MIDRSGHAPCDRAGLDPRRATAWRAFRPSRAGCLRSPRHRSLLDQGPLDQNPLDQNRLT